MHFTVRNILFISFLTAALVSFVLSQTAFSLEVHKDIRGPFTSVADVTRACLECHTQQAHEVLQSTHWTWVRQRSVNDKNILFGKRDSLTGFAIDVTSNPQRCMGCHISTSRPEVNLKTPTPEMVDCLVCHDTTGLYRQIGLEELKSGNAKQLITMARNVGLPGPHNCLTCHFADCGLPVTQRSLSMQHANTRGISDFHLDRASTPFTCQKCHGRRSGHNFSRTILTGDPGEQINEEGCASCHTSSPHTLAQLNSHVSKVACRTCHIPEYARLEPAIISWNWMMIGRANRVFQVTPGGSALVQDENGFTSARQIEPVYLWDDGTDQVYTRGQRIRPEKITFLQKPSEQSPAAKIAPFRVIYGTQMYDAKYRYLISPLLQDNGTVFFPTADWTNIARQGMENIVLPFSGEYGFATTVRFQRLNHGIAPAKEALGCVDCHGAESRMPWKDLGYDGEPLLLKEESVQNTAPAQKITKRITPPAPGYSQFKSR